MHDQISKGGNSLAQLCACSKCPCAPSNPSPCGWTVQESCFGWLVFSLLSLLSHLYSFPFMMQHATRPLFERSCLGRRPQAIWPQTEQVHRHTVTPLLLYKSSIMSWLDCRYAFVSEAFDAWKDDRRFVNCLTWHRASPGPLAEMVDPHNLLTFHDGAVCHLEHLWPHCSVRREGTWGPFSVEFEIRCSDGQTPPLPCSRYGAAWIMQSGFSPQLFFFLVAWDTLW